MNDTDICRCCGCERERSDIGWDGVCSACDQEAGEILFDDYDTDDDDE